jgi:hypothetical protein
MPTVYRAMKIDPTDGLPLRGQSATKLGIRPSDYDVDPETTVVSKNGQGCSVSPSCSQIPQPLRPRKFPGGLGGKTLGCFRLGDGPWQAGTVAPGLELSPDPDDENHGFLIPAVPMLLKELEEIMDATRNLWQLV